MAEGLAARGQARPAAAAAAAASTRRRPAAARSACSSSCRGSRSARGPAAPRRTPSRREVFMPRVLARRHPGCITARRLLRAPRPFSASGRSLICASTIFVCGHAPPSPRRLNTPPSDLTLATRGSRLNQTGCVVPPHGTARPVSCWPGITTSKSGVGGPFHVLVLLQVVAIGHEDREDRLGRGDRSGSPSTAPGCRGCPRPGFSRQMLAAISPVVYIWAMPGASSSPSSAIRSPQSSSQVHQPVLLAGGVQVVAAGGQARPRPPRRRT